ncbi:hypothetical protein [Mycobacterium adipatum]|uniref:hypothetical protein n=1 Tax=Mycobacterium adipatum TaxID=1682113 RepID=UPI000AA97491|nr:hypothetical protein [Mycobacterium adipatum]
MTEILFKIVIVISAPVIVAAAVLIHKAVFWNDDEAKDARTPPYCGTRPGPNAAGATHATPGNATWAASNLASTPAHRVRTRNDAMTTRHDSVNEVIPGGTLTSANAFTARLAAQLGPAARWRR